MYCRSWIVSFNYIGMKHQSSAYCFFMCLWKPPIYLGWYFGWTTPSAHLYLIDWAALGWEPDWQPRCRKCQFPTIYFHIRSNSDCGMTHNPWKFTAMRITRTPWSQGKQMTDSCGPLPQWFHAVLSFFPWNTYSCERTLIFLGNSRIFMGNHEKHENTKNTKTEHRENPWKSHERIVPDHENPVKIVNFKNGKNHQFSAPVIQRRHLFIYIYSRFRRLQFFCVGFRASLV